MPPLPFHEKQVLFTGKIPNIDRDIAAASVHLMGGTVVTSIKNTTDILVVGNNPDPNLLSLVDLVNVYRKIPIQIMFAAQFRKIATEFLERDPE